MIFGKLEINIFEELQSPSDFTEDVILNLDDNDEYGYTF